MTGQLDLLSRPGVKVNPPIERTEPRFWVRRVVIWEAPGVVVREIALGPGLNILWSPDPADRGQSGESETALGHGSGKTLFCRLLRYVLGEDRFAPDDQRSRIALAFREGMVGAEVIIDGTQWSVVRPIGHTRHHYAVRDASLEQVLSGDHAPTGIEPFLRAIAQQILSPDVSALLPVEHPSDAWLVALAWLSRDQECRFDKVLDWRSSDSDSGSPIRSWSGQSRLDALRALVGAIDPAEYKLRDEISAMASRQQSAEQAAGREAWNSAQLHSHLVAELGLSEEALIPGRLSVDSLRRAAKSRLARLASVAPGVDVTDLNALRSQEEEATARANAIQHSLAAVRAQIPEIEATITLLKGERPGLSVEIDHGEHPLCPICDVPIDRALAEGCRLSHKLPDVVSAKKRWEQVTEEIKTTESRLQQRRAEREQLQQELAPAQERAAALRQQVRAVERIRDERSDAWFNTRKLIADADRLEQHLMAEEGHRNRAASLLEEIERKRGEAAAFRDSQADVFSHLSTFFDAIIRDLVGSNAGGKATLDGNGLKLSIELGGERSTAAIDSLKVIAFDLAVMCMSIEGATHLPAFLIHDSPREADLGLSVYHRLFQLALKLEQEGSGPLFQYIVTTTTRPPDTLLEKPWLSEILGGSPASARLLRRDL